MTDLEASPVTRRTSTKYKGRRLVVELRSDDTIALRGERLRFKLVVPLVDVMRYAERAYMNLNVPKRKK